MMNDAFGLRREVRLARGQRRLRQNPGTPRRPLVGDRAFRQQGEEGDAAESAAEVGEESAAVQQPQAGQRQEGIVHEVLRERLR